MYVIDHVQNIFTYRFSAHYIVLIICTPVLHRYQRRADQQLREDQDAAYQESLAADREKERRRQEALEREQAEAREAQQRIEEEKRKEEVHRVLYHGAAQATHKSHSYYMYMYMYIGHASLVPMLQYNLYF